ncbi:MAG TPA: alpha-amylase family glycosyl hydrolase [Candidatus Methylomirabilis sp.]|nr:alpha-amylase family glycosyl hydrolase [Candidatus Methylomirabilis sp.]
MRRWSSRIVATLVLVAFFFGAAAPATAQQIERASTGETRYGAHGDADGWVHFVLYSPGASQVSLLLFKRPDATTPSEVIPMERHGTDWRIKIRGRGIGPGLLYLYQARGPREVSVSDQFGLLFNEHYYLSDPYSYFTQNVRYSAFFSSTPHTDVDAPIYAGGGKSVVYDHARDPAPGHVRVNPEDLIVYELHVQDYTARLEQLAPGLRGTYLGLAQGGLTTPGGLTAGIDHLVELGVTAVELMPVMEYDEETGNAPDRYNHWGYMTTSFFAPEARYAAGAGNQVVELKQLVKAFHDRGIAVFLDVVYNHTGEQGPWVADGRLAAKCFNFLCLAATHVYRSTPDGLHFSNSTGTGNDVDFSGGPVRFTKRLVTDSLALWHQTYGIDGFRFDLARILADGSNDAADWVDNDPRFAAAHLHAEPWDLAGQWWDFMDNHGWSQANNRWAKWLGRYRDKVRRFSNSGLRDRRAFKQLIEGHGSVSDGYGAPASTRPWRSVNFVAVHDGYTLRDCMFFTDTDGSHNCWDSGGDENLRRERTKLLLGVLLSSQGVPLILQGDEFGQTKSGARSQEEAHNTYNYESISGNPAINHVNWIDWRLKDGDPSGLPNAPRYGKEVFQWTKGLIALRKHWSHFRRAAFPEHIDGAPDDRSGPRNDGRFTYSWEGPEPGSPSQLAVIWWGKAGEPDLMVVYNEHWEPFTLTNLRDWSRGDWKLLARSWLGDPAHLCRLDDWEADCPAAGDAITVKGRSMAILISDSD